MKSVQKITQDKTLILDKYIILPHLKAYELFEVSEILHDVRFTVIIAK